METTTSYPEWLKKTAELGADKVLEEYDTKGVYPEQTYAAGRGNEKIFGCWLKGEGKIFQTGMNFRTTRRKFRATWMSKLSSEADTVRIEGSKGNIYEVAKDGSNCTCPGFKFRNKCKHVTAAKEGKL
jgi:hypothetical protein